MEYVKSIGNAKAKTSDLYKNKKIFFVFPHLEPPPFDILRHERINRELYLVKESRALGIACELLRLHYNRAINRVADDIGSILFPVDNPQTGDKFNYLSTSLLERIEKEKPDLVVYKGMGYRLNRFLVQKSKHRFRFAFIAGGGTRDILAPYADFILAETHQQIADNFKQQQEQGRVAILPKLNLPDSLKTCKSKKFDIINIGGFNENKNQGSLTPLAKDFRVAMIGDGPLLPRVQQAIHPFSENVYMPGNLPREEIPSLIAQSRLMVHPAHREGLARVVMESFACGVPVVASRRAMPNAFEHGVHGLLVEPEDIVPAARELLANEARLHEMGIRAYQYAKENCSEEAVLKVIQRMYDKIFSEPPVFGRNKYDLPKLIIQSAGILALSSIKRTVSAVGLKK